MNLKKIGEVFTSKSVGTGPSSDEEREREKKKKRKRRRKKTGRGLAKVEKHWSKLHRWPNVTR